MSTNIRKIGASLLAIGLCVWSANSFAQTTTTTVTSANGAFTEYVPGSQTVVLRSETSQAPVRYVVTKQTTVVDQTGAPITVERIPVGAPVSLQYTGTGDRQVVSRIVVQKPAAAVTEKTTTTTTTTAPLTHHEKHELKEAEEHRHKAAKEAIEHPERAAEPDHQ
jgi:hypothetical protein